MHIHCFPITKTIYPIMPQVRKLLPAIFLLIFFHQLNAQQPTTTTNPPGEKFYMGIGAGQEYGGLGLKAEYLAVPSLAVFLGFGYNLVTPAYNAGLSYKILPSKRITPTIQAMYGYNAAIKIKGIFGNSILEKTYYGATFGAGLDFKARSGKSKFSFAVLVPLRNSDFNETYDRYKNNGYEFEPGILPVTFSFGFNFPVRDKRN